MDPPAESDLPSVYDQEMKDDYRRRYLAISWRQRKKWRRRLRLIESLRDGHSPGTILDIGCSYGAFLSIAQDAGWTTTGIEIMQDGINTSRSRLGHDRVYQNVTALTVANYFDVVCMWDVIEHLTDPKNYLWRLYDLLKPNGLLAIATVNTQAWSQRWFGDQWAYFVPPEHETYFNPGSLHLLLNKTGFEPVFCTTKFVWHVFWRSMKDRPPEPSVLPLRIIKRMMLMPIAVAAKLSDAGETLELVARKAGARSEG